MHFIVSLYQNGCLLGLIRHSNIHHFFMYLLVLTLVMILLCFSSIVVDMLGHLDTLVEKVLSLSLQDHHPIPQDSIVFLEASEFFVFLLELLVLFFEAIDLLLQRCHF